MSSQPTLEAGSVRDPNEVSEFYEQVRRNRKLQELRDSDAERISQLEQSLE